MKIKKGITDKKDLKPIQIKIIALCMLVVTVTIVFFGVSLINDASSNNKLFLMDPVYTSFDASSNMTNDLIQNLFINEVMADNDITIPGPDVDYPDWIELYNSGPESLDLSGLYLTDDFTNPTKWQFPDGTSIDSEDYLLVWGDGHTHNDSLYASFQLNANGDSVALFADDGTTVIDSVTFKKQIRDTSYGRLPDGGNTWEYLSDPSPGWSNGEPLSDGEMPVWMLPLLIVLLVLILILVIVIKKIMVRREFK